MIRSNLSQYQAWLVIRKILEEDGGRSLDLGDGTSNKTEAEEVYEEITDMARAMEQFYEKRITTASGERKD